MDWNADAKLESKLTHLSHHKYSISLVVVCCSDYLSTRFDFSVKLAVCSKRAAIHCRDNIINSLCSGGIPSIIVFLNSQSWKTVVL